jgi:hypothetical protein
MNLNARQLAYLHSLGLAEGASDAQVKAFVATLGALQVKFLNGLADGSTHADAPAPGAATPPAAPAPSGNATPPAQPPAQPPAPSGSTAPAPQAPAAPDVSGAVRQGVQAEQARQRHIRAVAAQTGLGEVWAQTQIDGNFSVEAVNAAALNQLAANRQAADNLGGASVQVGTDRHASAVGQAVLDAVCARFGGRLLAIDPVTQMPIAGQTRQPHAWAGRFRGNALMMAQTYLQLCGRDTTGLSAPQIAQAVFIQGPRIPFAPVGMGGMMTSSDFPLLLANSMGMNMQQRYVTYPTQWRLFATEVPASDFREQTMLRVGDFPVLPEVKEGGEYSYVTFGEEKEVYTLVKRGHIVALSWEMILNDQLGAFNAVIAMQGDAAARTDDTLAFAAVTGNPTMGDTKALFHADHGNFVDVGSGAAPSVTTLNAMELAMGQQKGVKRASTDEDVYLNLMPGVILVPRALKATADALRVNQYLPVVGATDNSNAVNPWQNRLQVASHALMDAVATHGTYQWACCTDPAVNPAMLMAYLDGYQGPQMTQESGFDTDTRKYKVTHCRVAKPTDWRFWYLNRGR